jgi:hypothetical protein
MNTWIRSALLPLSLLALAACAGHASTDAPKPNLVAPVKDVAREDQADYWLVDRDSLMPTHDDAPPAQGCFRAEALIDSDGRVFYQKMQAVVGEGTAQWVPGFLAHVRFNPAPANPGKTPIRTTLSWDFSKSESSVTVPAASAAAAMKAAAQAENGPPPGVEEWNKRCEAEMDQQMHLAPAAATGAPKP